MRFLFCRYLISRYLQSNGVNRIADVNKDETGMGQEETETHKSPIFI